MLLVGLTGGIGSGKSTVATRLVQLGARLIDADRLSREVVAPGTEGLAAVRARFGEQIIAGDGGLDRGALGELVFNDAAARAALEGIIHPAVAAAAEQAFNTAEDDEFVLGHPLVVVHDVPLLVETHLHTGYDLVLVVSAPQSVRVERLVRDRAMSEQAALGRIAAQASDEERAAVADVVLVNDGSIADLVVQVDQLWAERLWPRAERLWAKRVAAKARG